MPKLVTVERFGNVSIRSAFLAYPFDISIGRKQHHPGRRECRICLDLPANISPIDALHMNIQQDQVGVPLRNNLHYIRPIWRKYRVKSFRDQLELQQNQQIFIIIDDEDGGGCIC